MPAAAVIPAPIAYIKAVAVKKLVVGCEAPAGGPSSREGSTALTGPETAGERLVPLTGVPAAAGTFTLKKLACSKQAGEPEWWCME